MSLRDDVFAAADGELDAKPLGDRLSLGVAARLSRYLQVLTQARKMGKDTISSQELSDYTHINSTQIRRDLSPGKPPFEQLLVHMEVEELLAVERDHRDALPVGDFEIGVGGDVDLQELERQTISNAVERPAGLVA